MVSLLAVSIDKLMREYRPFLSILDLMRVARAFEGRISNRKVTRDVDGNPVGRGGAGGKRKRGAASGKQQASVIVRRSKTVPRHLLLADVSSVDVRHHIFDGLEFCTLRLIFYQISLSLITSTGVMNGEETGANRKHALEILVHEYGGKPVQTPTEATFCVIASTKSELASIRNDVIKAEKSFLAVKVQSVIALGLVDVIRPEWILECTRANQLIPFEMRFKME